ncbi:MAG: ATP-dependent helicase [Spirochaetaceae bacterium]|jgi:DNA helicase-2/ATP-dependent DNA helicase PcrA|nr:ATP-dependent helicase [Spirochaetaceae bacterium]
MKKPGYLSALNNEQLEAVLHEGSPLLILAGAGSGKTRVITTKIAYLIREADIPPASILAVTFTNKAAREMAGRACAIDERAGQVMMRTFHSFGAWFLRRYADEAGLVRNFTIYDEEDSRSLVSKVISNFETALSRSGAAKSDAKMFAHGIALAKDYLYTPQDARLSLINHLKDFPKIYSGYEQALSQSGNADFGDLIKKPVEILKDNAHIAAYIRGRFRIILVDEYQDANTAQFELLKALYGNTGDTPPYLCVVGDDDQSIYRFRGAEVKNILQFREQFEGAQQIKLERNYRSTQEILSLANSVIAYNKGRLGKTLSAERGAGQTARLIRVDTQEDEALFCANLIKKAVKDGAKYSDWAILYRTNAQSLGFEAEFLREKIPYRIIGSLKFYEREEIKDALSLLSFTVNPRDEVSFRRIVNKPARGIGATSLEKIISAAEAHALEIDTPEAERWNLEIACVSQKDTLGAKAKKGLEEFLSAISHARALLEGGLSVSKSDISKSDISNSGTSKTDTSKSGASSKSKRLIRGGEGLAVCIAALLNDSRLAEHYHEEDDGSGQRLSNLQELANGAVLFPLSAAGLISFLDRIELDKSLETEENAEAYDRVNLITLHNTKGMEFRRVIISACEQGLFPRNDKKTEDLEEERRLFYVGATRAMDELYFTCADSRRVFGSYEYQKPSIFLKEADEDFLETIDLRSGWKGGRASAWEAGKAAHQRVRQAMGENRVIVGGTRAVIRRSSDGRWTLGDRLFHDDEGYGEVCAISETDDGPVIKARFETGRERNFLSEAQSGSFMKVLD